MEASPSPVYGAALLMRFGLAPIRGSNPRASAQLTGRFRSDFRSLGAAGFCVICPVCGATGVAGRLAGARRPGCDRRDSRHVIDSNRGGLGSVVWIMRLSVNKSVPASVLGVGMAALVA